MDLVVPRNRELADLLSRASSDDLNVLADLITDFGKGRIALDSSVKAIILKRKDLGDLQSIADVLESEIRGFGGNTVANIFRSNKVSYVDLAIDVAKDLGGKPTSHQDIFEIEGIAIERALLKFEDNSSDVATTSPTSLSAKLGPIISALVSTSGSLMGTAATAGASGVAGFLGGRAASLIAPPLAALAAGTALYQASSPALRITTPAVLQIAKIRRSRFDSDLATYHKALEACM